MTCHKPMLAILREHGVRLTAQRALILEDLFHHPGHCTAEEIFGRVSELLPGLNRATVYRTLELLQQAQVVTAFNGRDGITVYELMGDAAHHHHHLRCRRCNTEISLEAGPVEALKAEIQQRYGFKADLDHLYINGLCAQCAEESSKGGPNALRTKSHAYP